MFIRRMPRIAKPRRISSKPTRPESLLPLLSGIDLATCMGRISVPHSALPDEQGGQRFEPEGSEVTGISQEEKVKFLVQGQAQERRPVRAALLLAIKGYVRPRRRHPAAAPSWKRPGAGGCPSSDGANFDHLGDVVAQHVLDAHLEGG